MCQCDSLVLGSSSLDILLFYSAVVWPPEELIFWEVKAFLPGMAQACHCLSMCGAPAHNTFGSLLLLDILAPHCAVLHVHGPLTTSVLQSIFVPDGGGEVKLIDGNDCTLSDSPVTNLYRSHWPNYNVS